jgi:hypothetical protein
MSICIRLHNRKKPRAPGPLAQVRDIRSQRIEIHLREGPHRYLLIELPNLTKVASSTAMHDR